MDHATWLDLLFAHDTEDWYFDLAAETPALPAAETAAHVLRLLEAPGATLSRRTDAQVAAGLKYLFDHMSGFADVRQFGDPAVTADQRGQLARHLDRLWTQVFAPRCAPVLGHLSEPSGALETACYMFWDGFCGIETPDPAERSALDAVFVETMGRILALPHPACQESALHGLGHWGAQAPERCAALIDAWLARGGAARPELVRYARAAGASCIQ